ncbi:O-acyltransferase like protein-like [Uranotaenia lowii]|uniref:O-acyltransferase like protein-like n=1 Tax=Uranotaenia lowii TaxID=190385 RepID=UPI00247AEF95|nr:O-acyltransferase like protein-like [Uranotaenia lowii]
MVEEVFSLERGVARSARACINRQIADRYQLRVEPRVSVRHCYREATERPRLEILEICFLLLVLGLILVKIPATRYDMRLNSHRGYPPGFYHQPPAGSKLGQQLLVTFSFPRNIQQLKDPVSSRSRRDLQFLEAFRVIQMIRVVIVHVVLALAKVPQANTAFVESMQYHPLMVIYIAEFQNYIQTFLSISGMLLVVNFAEQPQKTARWKTFLKLLMVRLARLVPVYWFVMLLETSVVRRFMVGPIGHQFVGEGFQNCRRWWWANLLFINNFTSKKDTCLLPTWYLATEIQLFVIGLAAVMLIWKFPRLRVLFFAIMFTYAGLFPTLASYLSRLPPAMTTDLKTSANLLRAHPYQMALYFPFHQNIGAYTFGMFAGFIYLRYRDSKRSLLHSNSFKYLFKLATLLYLVCILSVYWMVIYRTKLHRLVLAIYSTVFKQSWAIETTFLQLFLALSSSNYWWKRALSHPIFGVGGKLCYCIFLIHFIVIEMVFGQAPEPVVTSIRSGISFGTQVFMWSLSLGALLAIYVEQPAANLLKLALGTRKQDSETSPALENNKSLLKRPDDDEDDDDDGPGPTERSNHLSGFTPEPETLPSSQALAIVPTRVYKRKKCPDPSIVTPLTSVHLPDMATSTSTASSLTIVQILILLLGREIPTTSSVDANER